MSDYLNHYQRLIRYGHSDAKALLKEMATDPDHLTPGSNLRMIAADAFDEIGSSDNLHHEIARHLRSNLPLAVDRGRVLPATHKLHRMFQQMRRYWGGEHIMEQDAEEGPTPLRLETAKELDRLGRHHEAAILRSNHHISTYHHKVTGDYPRYAHGGGEILYPTREGGDFFCSQCQNGENGSETLNPEYKDDPQWQTDPQHSFIHEEGPPIHCAHCNREITSQYGDPDNPDDDN